MEAEKSKFKTRLLVAEVTDKLHKLGCSDEVPQEVGDEGLVVGEAVNDLVEAIDDIMPDVVDFEDENGQDGEKALEFSRPSACNTTLRRSSSGSCKSKCRAK